MADHRATNGPDAGPVGPLLADHRATSFGDWKAQQPAPVADEPAPDDESPLALVRQFAAQLGLDATSGAEPGAETAA